MHDWKITIEAWSYFGTPQSEVAPRVREYIVRANDFEDARKIADAIQTGVASHDKVWRANIWGVFRHPCPVASIT